TIEMTTFEPGQYEEDFAKAKGWCFDPETKQIQFLFPDPDDPDNPVPVPQPPLTEQLKDVKKENTSLKSRVSDVEKTITEILFS
ncbi:hypothetical protein ACM1RC_27655, partial [Paenibacillus azoreducens]